MQQQYESDSNNFVLKIWFWIPQNMADNFCRLDSILIVMLKYLTDIATIFFLLDFSESKVLQ